MHEFLPILLAVILLASCQTSDAATQRTVAGDTVMIANSRPSIADTIMPVEVQRYGAADGDFTDIFSQIFAFAVGPSGDVYVHDRDDGIRHFARSGEYVRHIARQGSGPGEVKYVRVMDVVGDGRVAVLDLGNRRVILYDPQGSSRSIPLAPGQPRYGDDGLRFHDDGTLWIGLGRQWDADAVAHPRPIFARLRDDGSAVDTVFTPAEAARECPVLSEPRHRVGYWEDVREPFVPKVKWTLARDGTLVVGCPASYTFRIHARDGRVTTVARPYTPVIASEAERDYQADQQPRPPRERPAYAAMIAPSDGRVWVWPTQPSIAVPFAPHVAAQYGRTHGWQQSWRGTFDVFDADGTWMAVVRLPEEARYSGYPTRPDVVIRGDTLWAVAEDSLDAQYIVKYLVPGLPGTK